ncbi:MAG: TAXI family TRAP transporter solute-binding subunit [Alphaproteobacteria bacterium]
MTRFYFIVLSLLLFSGMPTANAQVAESTLKERVNNGTVGIISGGINGTYIRIATDLASVLDEKNKLRILPMMGKGSIQNITDILYLRGTDIGIVQSDVLEFVKNRDLHSNIQSRIRYITKLYNEEFHLIADANIGSVADLAGRKVNFGVEGSGTFMTASTIFAALNIAVEPVAYDQALALEKIKSGEIAASVYVAGKPIKAFSEIQPGLFKLLPIEYSGAVRKSYLPSVFTAQDYPGLIPAGATVNTVAVGAVMAVFNWAPNTWRYAKVARFVDTFFSKFDEFQKAPRHKKWGEVNLAASLPGWKRFRAADEWLAKNKTAPLLTARKKFDLFLSSGNQGPISKDQKNELFKQFLRWAQTQG